LESDTVEPYPGAGDAQHVEAARLGDGSVVAVDVEVGLIYDDGSVDGEIGGDIDGPRRGRLGGWRPEKQQRCRRER